MLAARRLSPVTSMGGRGRRAAKGSAAGVAATLVSAVAAFVTVPVLLGYFGVAGYGLWVTAITLTAWVTLANLGLPQSLLNLLAGVPRGDSHLRQELVSTAWWASVALAVGLLVALALLEFGSVWPGLFNAPDALAGQARAFILALWTGVALSLPLAIPPVVYRSDQQVHLAALAEASTAIVRASLIILVVQFDLGVRAVAVAAAVAPVAVGLAVSVLVFRYRVGWPSIAAVRRSLAKRLVRTGLGFMGIGISALIISSADVLIIAQLLGPSAVPAYSVALSLLMLYLSLEVAVMDGLWPAYVEAAAKRERGWILVTHRTALTALTIAGLVFAVGLITYGQTLIGMWAGAAAVPPQSVLWVFAAIAVLQAMVLAHSRVLIGLGRVRIVTKLSVFGALVNLPTSVMLGVQYGLTGVALGTLIAYGVVLGLNIAEARRAFAAVGEDVREAGPR